MSQAIEVLIVEDDIRIADIHRRFIEKIDGFTVIGTATTGEQAKEWLELVRPQLVLLDVYLPDVKGIELVTSISRNHDVDIIMITASSEADVVRHALRGGVFDYVVKPLTFDRFKHSLENYRRKIEKLENHDRLSVEQIESLWNMKTKMESVQEENLPKGIDMLTLDKMLQYVSELDDTGATAEELSRRSGVSRSTARRYLEYLVSEKRVRADLTYGTVGRPERRYFRL